jgi:diacylglycerol kinase family enzyme
VEKFKKLEVSSKEEVPVECDGELIGKLPAVFTCIPRAIEIVVPKNFKTKTLKK